MKPALAATLLAASALAACVVPEGPAPTAQGWTQGQQASWYAATQGSRLLPWAWAQALERADGEQRFFAKENLARYGYLDRPGPLPVGFVIDDSDDKDLTYSKLRWFKGQQGREQWLGMNCAACHTAEIAYQGQRIRIDGGPAMADFQGFIDDFDSALAATLGDAAKFDRFARAALGSKDNADNRRDLRTALQSLTAWQGKVARANAHDSILKYGPARLDAFGHIFNKVAILAGPDDPKPNPSDAPVSYPFIWNTHQADRVQWNGIAERSTLEGAGSFDYGGLGRNTGEVIGVFGDVRLRQSPPTLGGYKSSVNVENLAALELILAQLRPPQWPATFPPVDQNLAATGKALYADKCESCHKVIAPDDLKTRFTVVMTPLKASGTDPWMACNAWSYEARSGVLEGQPIGYLGNGPKLGSQAPVAALLSTSVVGVLIGQKGQTVLSGGKIFLGLEPKPKVVEPTITAETLGAERQARLERCLAADPKLKGNEILAYKARPLNGIWATGPYLHNGSAPTLHDVLLPPAERPGKFCVGTREFDPVKVGFQTPLPAAPDGPVACGTMFTFDTSRDGNLNGGHDYGNAKFSPDQRRALVEYMKTL